MGLRFVDSCPPNGRVIWLYLNEMDGDDTYIGVTGFRHTKEMLAFIDSIDCKLWPGWAAEVYLGGHWEVNDRGVLYDFDGHVVVAETNWATFKREHRDEMQELARDDAAFRREIAMEAGMLHGCAAYNAVMGMGW